VKFRADPRLEALFERGKRHEDTYVDSLRGAGLSICDLREHKDPAATRLAIEAGYDVIVQAPLSNGVFNGIADVLLRVSSPTDRAFHCYEPVDTKLALETKGGTILQLCTYSELLQTLQGAEPERFHVVTPLGQETYRTAEFAAYYRHARSRLQLAMTAQPAPSTYPEPVTHCDVCKYWSYCDARRRSDDHPSLIAGISTTQRREFQSQDLLTLADIARAEGKLREPPARGSASTYLRLGRQARLQLASRQTAIPTVEALPHAPERGLARLPEPSPGDVFLDFEGDPFVAGGGLEYLTGFCMRDADDRLDFDQIWAFNAAREKRALETFVDVALARLDQHPAMHVYHFGAYEPSALKRLSARHATRREELDRLLRGRRFIDLHTVVREAFCIGVERYGLKELEPLHEFERRLDLRDAGVACRDLEIALELGEADHVPEEMRQRVATYNADDCLSTASLRDWLEARRQDAIARGETIDRPTLGDPTPSENVSERDQRIAALRVALSHKVPEGVDARTDEERGRALLAALLGYFRQEEKNAWWEHFRLRDLPEREHRDERQMLAGLRFVATLPREPRQRNARCQFSFPLQETAFAPGKDVYFVRSEDLGSEFGTPAKVEAIDFDAQTVVLNMGDPEARPSVVFLNQVVDSKALEAALLAFAECVVEQGFPTDGAYAVASELLLRRLPKRTYGGGGVLRRSDETNVESLLRLCRELNGGVLPVQGPPGSGKTSNGARAILELVAAGKKVGVTAVSHKVIDKLLGAVREAAAKAGIACPRLVHKHNDETPEGIEYVTSPNALAAVASDAVVGATAWLWADDKAIGVLDYLFIDEAGQMSLAHAIAAARSATNLVLLGDPQQLEQPQRGAHEDGADIAALVHLLGPGKATLGDEQGLFLDTTHRLHPAICAFTSEMYYEGRLESEPSAARQSVAGPSQYCKVGLHLVEVAHEGNQSQSEEEVEAVTHIAESLLQPGCTWTDRDGITRALEAEHILVVAPYNAQVSSLKTSLERLGVTGVGTVDKFQGQEAPVVIYSCTSSSPQDAPRGMPFLYDPHRFNVATSRAKCVVIVVASPKLFAPDCRTPEQMRWANGLCRYREVASSSCGVAGPGL
jgi:uncharacterized protein